MKDDVNYSVPRTLKDAHNRRLDSSSPKPSLPVPFVVAHLTVNKRNFKISAITRYPGPNMVNVWSVNTKARTSLESALANDPGPYTLTLDENAYDLEYHFWNVDSGAAPMFKLLSVVRGVEPSFCIEHMVHYFEVRCPKC